MLKPGEFPDIHTGHLNAPYHTTHQSTVLQQVIKFNELHTEHSNAPYYKQTTTNNNDLLEKYGGTKNCIYKE